MFYFFQENEENFIRSEQYVLSNLLYHHCLAVNSHNVRRSIDGLVLKFNVHGQHHRSQQLQSLTSRFVASPFFKDHDEVMITFRRNGCVLLYLVMWEIYLFGKQFNPMVPTSKNKQSIKMLFDK